MKSVKTKSRRELQLHSDQGFQYTSQAYFNLTKEYGITPSMSRRGNCYDNALAENFFWILKAECIYRHKPETFEEANKMIDDYIYFYNHERIQLKTGLSPLSLRQSCWGLPYMGLFLCMSTISGAVQDIRQFCGKKGWQRKWVLL